MEWIYLIEVVVVLLFFPYLRIFLKRLWLVAKIKKSVKNSGCCFVSTHALWMFGRKRGTIATFMWKPETKSTRSNFFPQKKDIQPGVSG